MSVRSMLFVPGDRPERFAKAVASGADRVILDLEDAVAPADKPRARSACEAFLAQGGQAVVRVNAASTDDFEADLGVCRAPGVLGIMLPKASSAQEIARLRARAQDLPVYALIETALGMAQVSAIAAAPGVAALVFGSVDFCNDMGMAHDEVALGPHRAALVLASRVAQIAPPIDGVEVDLGDEAGLQASCARARREGFGGKLCIHPKQVAVVHRSFSASAAEIAWAAEVVRQSEGMAGAFQHEGRMVDAPVLARARRLLSGAVPAVSP
jgi:citrate lyase subunit beta/citryl-CoA lyase